MVAYRQTPPIQWLPVFEAAASLLSFKKAAEQLHVTPPAVSQQIKSLEEWLGVQLFERHARRLSLTVEGEYYLQAAKRVMQAHKKGYLDFQRRFQNTSLHVSAPLFVTQELLIPNYLSFNDYSPATELRIEARMSLVDFETESMDAAIRFGDGAWDELDCQRLCYAQIAPVCSAKYLRENPISDWQSLVNHRLIYSSPEMRDWSRLFEDIQDQDHAKLVCDSYLSAIKSASEGLGVALAILPATNQWVNDGRLVLPLENCLATESGYWVVSPKSDFPNQSVAGFYRWARQLFDGLPPLNHAIKAVDLSRL